MKDKILTALKAAIGKTSINDKTLSAYVNIIADKIDDESQIETAIRPYVDVLKEFQGNINSVAAQASKDKESELAKTAEEKAAEEAAKKAAEESAKGSGDTPEWAKSLLNEVATLKGAVSSISEEKTQKTLAEKLAETLKSKNVPDWYCNPIISGRPLKDEDEVTAFAESIAAGWTEAEQKLAEQGLSRSTRPGGGNGNPCKEASQKECDEIAAKMNI